MPSALLIYDEINDCGLPNERQQHGQFPMFNGETNPKTKLNKLEPKPKTGPHHVLKAFQSHPFSSSDHHFSFRTSQEILGHNSYRSFLLKEPTAHSQVPPVTAGARPRTALATSISTCCCFCGIVPEHWTLCLPNRSNSMSFFN